MSDPDNQKDTPIKNEPDFHGAAIVDEDGNEILITEDMVQDACDNLHTAD